MNYQSYPDVKTQPNRKMRKSVRKNIFEANKLLGNKMRRERRDAIKEAKKSQGA